MNNILHTVVLSFQCSATCGHGVRVRDVACKRGANTVSKRQCSRQSQPKKKARCNLPACPVWYTGFWGQVSSHYIVSLIVLYPLLSS